MSNNYFSYLLFKCVNSIYNDEYTNLDLFTIGYSGTAIAVNSSKQQNSINSELKIINLYTSKLLYKKKILTDLIAISSNSTIVAISRHCEPKTDILEIHTGKLINRIGGYLAPPMLLSSDGKTIICADYEHDYDFAKSSKNIQILDTHTGKLINTFKWYLDYGYIALNYQDNLFVSMDEKIMLSVSENDGIWIDSYRYYYSLWDLTTNKLIVANETVKNWVVDSIVVTSDRQYLASGMRNGRLKVWDLVTDRMLYSYTGNSPSIMTSEGKFLICANFKDILIYDLQTKEVVCTLEGHKDRIANLVLSPDKQTLASHSIDGNIRVWSIPKQT